MSLIGAGSVAITGALAVFSWRMYRAFSAPKATAASVIAKYSDALAGKRVLVTGACTGLGLALTKAILEHAQVETLFFHGRSKARVAEAVSALPGKLQGACKPAVADLCSLKEVDGLVSSLKTTPPDVIICCAGVATLPARTATADGYEMQFAVNHLAHFHLVSALLPCLKPRARVVMVSSDLQNVGRKSLELDFTDLNSNRSYSWFGAYLASKYCNVLFARSLASRNVHAVSCSPGSVATDIDRYLSAPLRFCFRYLGPGLVAKTPEQGAASLAFCAVSDVDPGKFYVDCKVKKLNGPDLQEELWSASEDLVAGALKA